jgi:HEAT repeat protein
MSDPSINIRRAAIDVLSKMVGAGDPHLIGGSDSHIVDGLLIGLRDPAAEIRQKASEALRGVVDPRAANALAVMGQTVPGTNPRIVPTRAVSLGREKDAAPPIEQQKQQPLQPEKTTTIVLPNYAGPAALGPKAVPQLLRTLQSKDVQTRADAARALGEINDPRAAKALAKALHDNDATVIVGAHSYYMKRADAGVQKLLVESLNQFGDSTMANDFLASNDATLQAAGEAWGQRHGYRIGGSSEKRTLLVP